MVKKINTKPSQETVDEAMQVARATQRPNQTKEQTKLIAQGIEKGIALYKKQQKAKARAADKARKQSLKTKTSRDELPEEQASSQPQTRNNRLPWILLAVSWVLFGAYIVLA